MVNDNCAADDMRKYRFATVDADSDVFPAHGQDVSLHAVSESNPEDNARCSLWWSQTPPYPGEMPGVIGHFSCSNQKAGTALLKYAERILKEHRCTLVIGPMDGNTWRRYRVLTMRGDLPPFFLEPDNPDHWADAFADAGFLPLAKYVSAVVSDLARGDERVPRVEQRLAASGVSIRQINLAHFDEDLRRVHQLSLQSFRHNFLYTDLPVEQFVSQYESVKQLVLPEYVLLAEHGDMTVGFVFAVPNLEQRRRGEEIDTLILKTLAVAPGRTYAGLGAVLLDRVHKAAQARGFRKVIHALMHESNSSMNLSARNARVFRRYTLFAKSLR